MKWTPVAALPLAAIVVPVHATEYLTVQQAQAQMFPGATFQPVPLQLSDTVRDALNERSGVHEPFNDKGVWKASSGGWFIVDRVVGKHEKITYAVALDAKGAVRAVDILTYQKPTATRCAMLTGAPSSSARPRKTRCNSARTFAMSAVRRFRASTSRKASSACSRCTTFSCPRCDSPRQTIAWNRGGGAHRRCAPADGRRA